MLIPKISCFAKNKGFGPNVRVFYKFTYIVLIVSICVCGNVLLVANESIEVSFAKSKDELKYKLIEEQINNDDMLSWKEKAKKRNEAYEKIFGETTYSGFLVLILAIIFILIVRSILKAPETMARNGRTSGIERKELSSSSPVRDAYRKKYYVNLKNGDSDKK